MGGQRCMGRQRRMGGQRRMGRQRWLLDMRRDWGRRGRLRRGCPDVWLRNGRDVRQACWRLMYIAGCTALLSAPLLGCLRLPLYAMMPPPEVRSGYTPGGDLAIAAGPADTGRASRPGLVDAGLRGK